MAGFLNVEEEMARAELNLKNIKDKVSFREQIKHHRKMLFKHSILGSVSLVCAMLSCLTVFGLLAAETSWLWVALVFLLSVICCVGFLNHLTFMIVYSLTELKQK